MRAPVMEPIALAGPRVQPGCANWLDGSIIDLLVAHFAARSVAARRCDTNPE
jgi:hypothetical protein